ncbi:MAG TPA: outer membrane protein assembly factor BamE [Thermoanaerobaculia bacterium]|nr:outer membrane protein assembly factor BamE [Thermoanaerobaculia bacterium]
MRFGSGSAAVRGLFLGAWLGLALLAPGCGKARPDEGDEGEAARSQASVAEWDWLKTEKARLDEQRGHLALAKDPAEAERLRKEVGARTAELNRRLVDFINANAAAQPGDPPDERQRAAIRMKSDEDILLAREYVERGGDYRRAIEIYETALAADPDNERLRRELEATRSRRYMTSQRFSQVKEGMTQEEVRRLLGSPNLQDVRAYPERGITAWFYPKDASGAAAAVWFQKKAAEAEVYLLDFDAIQPPSAAPAPTPPPGR